jgi:hypothetical protein
VKKSDIQEIKEKISILLGQPLCELGRSGSMITVSFGEFVETRSVCRDENGELIRDENGKLTLRNTMIGRYGCNIRCSMRVTCGRYIIFASSDMLLPNTTIGNNPDFSWDAFDWTIAGNNYYDEMVAKHFGNEPFEFIVKKINVSKFGDVSIAFENNFVLDIFADSSNDDEVWRFFDRIDDDDVPHLVITGKGIERNEDEQEGVLTNEKA